MLRRENISYLVPRDPSIKSWSDRVKLPAPCTKNLMQLGTDEFEETMGDKIKVYLRLKPSVSLDNPYAVLSSNTLQTEAPKDSVSYKNVTNGVGKLIHKFTFTSILDQNTTQKELFKKCAVKSIKKFLSGENYLLMAYGTTSAGKTYTMQGNVEQPGVIPRALDFVFTALKDNIISVCRYTPYQYNEFLVLSDEQLKKDLTHKSFILSLDLTKYQRYPDTTYMTFQTHSSSGFSESYENVTFKEMQSNLVGDESFEVDSDSHQYSVWISMIEIYNEQVYDLLEIPNEKGPRPKLKFRDDEYGNTFVKNLRYVNVSSGHEAFQILQFGRSNLHLAPTALNHSSSRSHCIFTITLAKFLDYDSSSEAIISRFSFCDLAGMERAKKTLNVKDRLVESKAINTSLSILVKCLTAIKENQTSKEKKMIPYRESKLTKLFRDAVMGKEQFSLIVNVTTEPNLFDETLNVLKFSAIAQKIVPQKVFAKPKMIRAVKRSRFSRIVVNSSYSNKTIIDWEASAAAESKVKEESIESGSTIGELQDMVEVLREQLMAERKRCEQIESEIREELTTKFSEILKKQNENNQIRLESETEGLREMYEKKEKRLVRYYEMLRRKKRIKLDGDESDFSDEENKSAELKKDVELLKSENSSLKEQLQELHGENKKFMSECSELKFKLVEKDRMLEAMQRTHKANEEGGDALEKELRKQLDEANAKISHFKSLLDEAASDYKELEENNKYLRNENEILEQHLTEYRETVADLKNENAELQKMLSHKTIVIDKLEDANEKIREELKTGREEEGMKKMEEMQTAVHLKEIEILRDQLTKTSERLEQSREECEELRGENLNLEKELEIAKLKIADFQCKILSLEESSAREMELERKLEKFREEMERAKEFESKAEELAKENAFLEDKCREFEDEVKSLQKEVKDLIGASKQENEKLQEIESLTKENEFYQKETLSLKKKISELEEELKRQTENFETAERKSKLALETLQAKFDAVEYQNSIMKNLKDEAERQAYEVPQLHEKIKQLEKEIENREKDLESFNENRKAIFVNYEKELTKLLEENERLRKDVLFVNEVVAKTVTPLKNDKAEISRLKESVKKKDEEINKLKAEVESIKKTETESAKKFEFVNKIVDETRLDVSNVKESLMSSSKKKNRVVDETIDEGESALMKKPETESTKKREIESAKKSESVKKAESETRLEVPNIKENGVMSSQKKKNKEIEETVNGRKDRSENTPEKITKQIADLSIQTVGGRSTRKKVDLLEETIHPSTIKNTTKGRKKKENGKEIKEIEKAIEDEKENILVKKKSKCYKKLFIDNDFDGSIDLNASPLEKVSRLRPRK